jgi:hypothetical protein
LLQLCSSKVKTCRGASRRYSQANQVSLQLFLEALNWCGCGMDIDEVECIVANLIFRKFIKGYISHKLRVLVLAKNDPFPSLS